MAAAFPLHWFQKFGELSAREMRAVEALGSTSARYKRHRLIRAEDASATSFYLLVDGWVAAALVMRDGRRQILKVHLPGDAVGTASMCVTRTVEELTCVTDVTLIEVPLERFWKLFEEHPRMGARFMLSVQLEQVALMDRLVLLGRGSAAARVAASLLDLIDRLAPLGLVHNDSFLLELTQDQIGDLLGLTGIHVNRTLRTLSDRGMIERSGRNLRVVDRRALEYLAERPQRTPFVELERLPDPR